MIQRNALAKILAAKSKDELIDIGNRFSLLKDGKIDLSGAKLPMSYKNLSLDIFRFNSTDLSGSRFLNCPAENVVFERCRLDRVTFQTEKATKVSMIGVSFFGCSISGANFGPRTLDLSAACFVDSDIRETQFMFGNLSKADFQGARLRDVRLRSALLDGANFKNALLQRVCFEEARLIGADFTNAIFSEMEHWGEPNFDGAVISDSLRYKYGIVKRPVEGLDKIIANGGFSAEEERVLLLFRDRVAVFATGTPEAMLIAEEYEDIVPLELFVQILKQLKNPTVTH